jgi:hypothetical protein
VGCSYGTERHVGVVVAYSWQVYTSEHESVLLLAARLAAGDGMAALAEARHSRRKPTRSSRNSSTLSLNRLSHKVPMQSLDRIFVGPRAGAPEPSSMQSVKPRLSALRECSMPDGIITGFF